jgi:lipoprotein-anchoring transpeptidase ErfK/SrfK
MSHRTVHLAAVAFILAIAPVGAQQSGRHTETRRQSAPQRRTAKPAHAAAPLPCGDMVSFAVLLDRLGFSPGEITGTRSPNLTRALAAFQDARGLTQTKRPDCETWRALDGDSADPALTTYAVTSDDAKGPFEANIPRSLVEQASLPDLAYRSLLELLAERFHASPALIQKLNPGKAIEAGAELKVPAVMPFDADAKPSFNQAAAGVTVTVSRDEGSLRVTRADDSLMLFAPVTTGGQYDPLPLGEWKVTGIEWHPVFHYNPELFWDAKPEDSKATIQPGPNGPVGVIWIGLNIPHYGLHGSPEPGRIGQTESHGCVRLTNWDAARVASLVQPGTRVIFR